MTKREFDNMFREYYMPSIFESEAKYHVRWTPDCIDRSRRAFEYDCAIDAYKQSGELKDRDYARPRWLWTLRLGS